MFVILTFISIGHLLFGSIPESATLMICGISMIGLAVGLRRILKQQELSKPEHETAEGNK